VTPKRKDDSGQTTFREKLRECIYRFFQEVLANTPQGGILFDPHALKGTLLSPHALRGISALEVTLRF
jgi:hypothetical protein